MWFARRNDADTTNKQVVIPVESRKQMEYTIVESDNSKKVIESVNELLNDGYELVGGISTSITDDEVYYTQAMVKKSI